MTPELGFSRRQAKGEGKNMSDMRRPGDGRERDNPQRAQTHPPLQYPPATSSPPPWGPTPVLEVLALVSGHLSWGL